MLKPWRIAKTQTVLRNRWIHLRADDCVREDGVEIAPYYILEYPDWAQVVAIDAQERLIAIRQYRHGLGRIALEIPSGCVDAADACPISAGARELREETGYVSDDMRLVGATWANPANHTNRIHILLAENAICAGAPQLDDSEDIVTELIPLTEVARLMETGGFDHAAQIASLHIALAARKRVKK